jgi:ferredoxin
MKFSSRVKKEEAIKTAGTETDESRRKFFLAGLSAMVAAPGILANEKAKLLSGQEALIRQTPISPPGAKSAEHLLKHCSSCHLCISKCPSQVLKPAFLEYGLGGMMQPTMYFEKGFCNYDCVVCSEVCPNHALVKLTKEEKHRTQTGHVVFNQDICIVITEGTNCGACSEHCPTQAVKMIPYENGLTIPFINTDICVGCGGCEFICPVRPNRAIFVEGNSVHKEALVTLPEENVGIEINDFGF